MATLVLTLFIIEVFVITIRLCLLSWKEYPRTVTFSRGQDCLGLLMSGGIAVWCAWLLWA